jgi:hypothetical protein
MRQIEQAVEESEVRDCTLKPEADASIVLLLVDLHQSVADPTSNLRPGRHEGNPRWLFITGGELT